MAENMLLKFKLFGDFLYTTGEDDCWHSLEEVANAGVGKKQCAFLVYLLLNHRRKITATELINHFWPEEGKDPVNSLKNTLYKTRVLLGAMFPGCKNLILTQSGGYVWNSEVSVQLDTELFEDIYHTAKNLPDAERIVHEQEAFSLYRGDILPGVSADWLDHLNTYYRSVSIDICKSLAVLLREDERWEDVIWVCRHAYSMSPEMEEFTVCLMQALVTMGTPELAIKHYEEYRAMLWQQFGLIPSDQVEQIYALAADFSSNTTEYAGELICQLTKVPESPKAFQCSLLVFRNFVQMELRNMMRSHHESSIVILSAGKLDSRHSSTDTRRLERILLYGLRAGDPFTRLNKGSFVLLLPGASEENAHKVMERIERNFHTTYPRSKARLRYKIFPQKTEN